MASKARFLISAAALASSTLAASAFTPEVRETLDKADPASLERIGRHLMTGLDSISTAEQLVEKRAVSGLFISDHNVRRKSAAQIRAEIEKLQSIRARQGLPPLLIAADQEGGPVSRLTPPLKPQPTLGSVVAAPKLKLRENKDLLASNLGAPLPPDTDDDKQKRVEAFATAQADGLKSIGVSLNFSPVVDLKTKLRGRNDGETNLTGRAISDDAALVTKTAGWYCAAMAKAGVMCTLKHFPGLGRITVDTHRRQAGLKATREELSALDWTPYRALMNNPGVTTMLGHIKLETIDAKVPASFSEPVVSGLIRTEWNHDGVLITDDFSMGAVTKSPEGKGGAAVKALNAGVDIVLVSWGERDLNDVLKGLLEADMRGQLDRNKLEKSTARIAKARLDTQTAAQP